MSTAFRKGLDPSRLLFGLPRLATRRCGVLAAAFPCRSGLVRFGYPTTELGLEYAVGTATAPRDLSENGAFWASRRSSGG